MSIRYASAVWEGNLLQGNGQVKTGSGAVDGPYSFSSRFEEGKGTNPEELIGAAHAGCFSMAFANILSEAGFTPKRIRTESKVFLEKGEAGFFISKLLLTTKAEVSDIDPSVFLKHAGEAKSGCPVSRALSAVPIELKAELV